MGTANATAGEKAAPIVKDDDNDGGQLVSPDSNLTELSPVSSNVTESSVFLQDDASDMTYSRRIALFLMRFKCYYNLELVQCMEPDNLKALRGWVGKNVVQEESLGG